jgi:hypothetical protein
LDTDLSPVGDFVSFGESTMKRMMKYVFLGLLLSALPQAEAQTINAASCSTADVQTAINTAKEGQTVNIPPGSCTWTTGVSISGKGINVVGAGFSPIIAISSSTLTLGTGSKTLTVQGADPGVALSISPGTSLTIAETGTEANFMTGTVTSYSSGTLVMDITSSGGTCGSNGSSNCKRWLIEVPQNSSTMTLLTNNNTTNTPLFEITEDAAFHTSVSNMTVTAGTGNAHVIQVDFQSGGQPVLMHNLRITGNPNNGSPPSGNATMIMMNTLHGVIWHSSFDSDPFNISTLGAISVQDPGEAISWNSVSNMGNNGSTAVYAEDNDFHAMATTTSTDENGRAVWRYNLYDNSGVGTHGADTSNYGQRYFELYNNNMVFEGYTDGSTFNIQDWVFMRGGTGVITNNTMSVMTSQDWGAKSDVDMTVINLQRNSGPDPCWGSATHTAGQFYHAPRQVGIGYVTGTGTINYSPLGINNQANDSITYGGDSEPFYIWGNNRSPLNAGLSNDGSTACGTSPDNTANYVVLNRDYFNGSTAKPGWSPYTYPHPLRGSQTVASSPAPPIQLKGVAK